MIEPVVELRRLIREDLADLDREHASSGGPGPVLVACSGGADSLALAVALGAEAARTGRPAGGVTVDHGLQQGSADRARAVAGVLADLGLDPVEVLHVRIDQRGEGPEGGARRRRYAALSAAADRHRAGAVLLGHTRDDQAETVLLGLARGSGARSLAGMPARNGRFRRPLLGLERSRVRAALPATLPVWEDPHNADSGYARSRVRHTVLPAMERELGPGIGAALARSADLLRADADALDDLAREAARSGLRTPEGYDVVALARLPRALRWRILRSAAIDAGCRPTDLTAAHVTAVDALIVDWRGQKGVDLPGAIRARRRTSFLRFEPL